MSFRDTSYQPALARDEARTLFAHTMALVAITAAFFAGGAYLGRDLLGCRHPVVHRRVRVPLRHQVRRQPLGAKLEPELREALVVGRPIADA